MPGPFGRRREKPAEKPTEMTYDGTNGAEMVDWARDGDLSPRFVDGRLGQPARVLLPLEGGQGGDEWVVVPAGAVVYIADGVMHLELPDDTEEPTKEEEPPA